MLSSSGSNKEPIGFASEIHRAGRMSLFSSCRGRHQFATQARYQSPTTRPTFLQNTPTGRLGIFQVQPTHADDARLSEYPNRQVGDLSDSAYTRGRRTTFRIPQPAG